MRKIGGIYFWRVGRLGGSIYVARRKVLTYQDVLNGYQPTQPRIDSPLFLPISIFSFLIGELLAYVTQ